MYSQILFTKVLCYTAASQNINVHLNLGCKQYRITFLSITTSPDFTCVLKHHRFKDTQVFIDYLNHTAKHIPNILDCECVIPNTSMSTYPKIILIPRTCMYPNLMYVVYSAQVMLLFLISLINFLQQQLSMFQ